MRTCTREHILCVTRAPLPPRGEASTEAGQGANAREVGGCQRCAKTQALTDAIWMEHGAVVL